MMQTTNLSVAEISDPTAHSWWDQFVFYEKSPLALVFGCILGLAAPGFDQPWLAWIGVAPLLVLLSLCRTRFEATVNAFVFGLGFHLVALSWFFGLFPLRWMGVADVLALQAVGLGWLLESVHNSLLYAAFGWLIASLPMRPGFVPFLQRPYFPYMLAVPFVWVFLQWFVGPSVLFLGIPIDQLAYSQFRDLPLIQLAKLGGAGAVEFVLLLTNAALAGCLLEFPRFGSRQVERLDFLSPRVGAAFDLSVALALVWIGHFWGVSEVENFGNLEKHRLANISLAQAPVVPVAVVQGNVTVEEDRLKTVTPQDLAARQSGLSNVPGTSIVFLGEGSVSPAQRAPGLLLSSLKNEVKTERREVIAGSFDRVNGQILNSAFLLSPLRKDPQLYLKNRLTPFFEWWPWQDGRAELPETFREKLPSLRNTFARAAQTALLTSAWGKVGVSITGELIYPQLITQEVRQGASLLVNVSNLAWFRNAHLNRQLLAEACFRAVENERYVVLASNTGISAVVNPAGIIKSRTFPGRRGTLIDTVQFLVSKTPYTKMWWL